MIQPTDNRSIHIKNSVGSTELKATLLPERINNNGEKIQNGNLNTKSQYHNGSNIIKLLSSSSKGPMNISMRLRKNPISGVIKFNTEDINNSHDIIKSISGTYSFDYNIIHAHNLILSKLKMDYEEKSKRLQFEIQQEKYKIQKPQTIIKRKQSLKFIKEKEKQFDEIKDKKQIDSYLNESKSIIESYRSLGVYEEKKNFDGDNVESHIEDDETQLIRLNLISQYFKIASKYIYVNVNRKIKNKNCCDGCGTDISNLFNGFDYDTGTGWCPTCGLEKINFSIISSFDGVAITNKNYNERENFHKSLLRKQGKLGNTLPENLFILLDAHFASFSNLPNAKVIRSMKADEDGKKPGTSKRMIYDALAAINMTDYYSDGDLICREYWGWILSDLSHLEDQIMSDYDETQKIYKQLPKDWQSNINREYRLFKHLQMRGFKCKPEDFRMIGTREIIERYDNIWEQMIIGADNNNPEAGFIFIRTL